MIFIFSTTDTWYSKIIRWALGSKVSHFAIGEANICDSFVVDTEIGHDTRIQKLYEFRENNKIVYAFECDLIDIKESQRIFNYLYARLKNTRYDTYGIAWIGVCTLFFKKLFRKPLPKYNQWANRNDYFCSEIAEIIGRDLYVYCDIILDQKQMITPDVLLEKFLKSKNVKQVYILCDKKK